MNNLNKVLNLVKKTGDKIVVVPVPSTRDDDPYVIIPINQYEQMVSDKVDYKSMTEEEILNRVNREMSLWRQSQRELGFEPDMDFLTNVDDLDQEDATNISQTDDHLSEQDDEENLDENLDEEELTGFDEYEQKMKDLDGKELNYEQVPPPPDLPVIDMSFKDSDGIIGDIKNNEEEYNDFLVEPIE